ncbi:MAG: hypothetical protein FVQ82_01250 [Planctomycetes bacterium]|nr:hypothetical protein [Planctomycetota bacterium]
MSIFACFIYTGHTGYCRHFPPMVLGVFFEFFLQLIDRKREKCRYFEINEEKWRVFERFLSGYSGDK